MDENEYQEYVDRMIAPLMNADEAPMFNDDDAMLRAEELSNETFNRR